MKTQDLQLLLVDDENSLREPLAEYLHDHYGYAVTQAKNGLEALELLTTRQGQFDVALLDQVLDEGPGGLELLKRIKFHYPHIEVILFTGWGMAHGLEAMQAGAFRYLAKPFNAEELAMLIRHAAEHHALKGAAHEKQILEQLMGISTTLLSNQNKQEVLERILKGIQAIGFDRVRLYLLSENGEEMVGAAHLGMDEGFKEFKWKVQEDRYMQMVYQDLRPHIFRREEGQVLPFEEELSKQDVNEWICVPLIAEGKVIGKVSADNKFSQRTISEAETGPVALFTAQAAVALQNAQWFQETRQRADELETLRQNLLAITSELDQDQLLTTIIQQAVQLLHAQRGGIYEYDPQKEELTNISSYGYTTQMVGETLHVGEGMAGRLIASGEPFLLTDDYTTWKGRADKFLDRGFRAILEVPLRWQEKRIGVLFVDDHVGRKFDTHDASLLGLFADQAALALEKARGFTRLYQIKERLDHLIDSSFDAVIAIDRDDRIVIFNERAEAMLGYHADEMLGKNVAELHADIEVARHIHRTLETEGTIPVREITLSDKAGNRVPVMLSAKLIRDDQGQVIGQAGFMRDLRQIRLLEDRLRALIAVGNALNEILELNDVLTQVVDASLTAFPTAQRGSIHLYDEAEDLLILKITNHPYISEAWEALSFRKGEGVVGWVFEHNQAVALPQAHHDPRYKRIQHRDVPLHQSMLCVPLIVRHQAIGTLTLSNLDLAHAFTEEDLQLLSTFANQAAIAIDNARLYEEASRRARNLETLQNLALTVSSSLDLNETLKRACQAAVEFFNADHSGLVLFEEEDTIGQVAAEFPPEIESLGRSVRLQGVLLEEQLIRDKEPLVITDVAGESGLAQVGEVMYQEFNIHSTLFVPVVSNGKLLGSFSLDAIGHKRQFTPEEVALCKIFAAHVASAVENARLFQEAQQHKHLLAALDQASRHIRAEREMPKLLHQIVGQAVELLNCAAGCLFIHDPHRKELEISAVYGIPETLLSTRLSHNEGLAGLVTQKGASELVGDYATWPDRARIFYPYEFEAMGGVPLKNVHTGQVEAVLIVAGKFQAITPTSLEVLERFAAQAAIALQTSRLIGGEQRRLNQLSILHEISDYIQAAEGLDKIFHVVLTGITAGYGLSFNRAALFLLDERGEMLVGRMGIGYLDEQEARQDWDTHHQRKMEDFGHYLEALEHNSLPPTPVDERIKAVKFPLNTNNPNVLSDVVLGGGPAVALQDGIDSLPLPFVTAIEPALPLLVVPLTAQGKTIGLLVADNKFTREPITEEDIKVVTTFANSAALAIEKTRLLEEARRGQQNFRIFSEASNALVSDQDPDEVLEIIVGNARQTSGAVWVSLVLFDELGQPQQAIGSGEDFQQDVQHIIRPDGISMEVMQTGKAYPIENVRSHAERLNPFLLKLDIRAAICLPMSLQGKPMGVMWVHYETPRYFSDTEIEALQIYVNQAAIAYDAASRIKEKAKLLEQFARARNTAQIVAEVTTLGDLQTTLNSIVAGTLDALNSDVVTLYTYDQKKNMFGFPPTMVGVRYPEKVTELGRVVQGSVPYKILELNDIHVAENSASDHLLGKPFAEREGVKSSIGVPLVAGESKVGVMFINYRHSHRFTDDERTNVRLFSHQAAVAIRNAQLYEQTTENLTELQRMNDELKKAEDRASRILNTARIVAEVTALGNFNSTLNSIVIGTLDALGCDSVTLYTFDQEKDEFGFPPAMVGVQYPEKVLDFGFVAKDSPPYKILSMKDIHVAENIEGDAILGSPFAIREGIKSSIGVPLIAGEYKVGVMFINYRNSHRFTEDELTNIRLFSNQAAVAIRNAQQFDELKRVKGLIGVRTALAWVGMASSSWRHTIANHAITIREQIQLLRLKLKQSPANEPLNERLRTIERLANKILERPITAPLTADEDVQSIPVNELIRSRTNQLWEQQKYRSVKLTLKPNLESAETIRVSPEWFRRALDILIDNAVEATIDCKSREITILTERVGNCAEIKIIDNGTGIPAKIREKLFSEPVGKEIGSKGLGIGLLFAQTIVQTYHGNIYCAETGPGGTTMIISLPLEKPVSGGLLENHTAHQ